MIINWKKERVNVVPYQQEGSHIIEGYVTLLPGMNDIPDAIWERARYSLLGRINNKSIIEVGAKIETVKEKVEIKKKIVDPENTGKIIEITEEMMVEKVKVTGPAFRKLEAETCLKIVANTYNLKTLNKWKDKEDRDSIRLSIMNQIETVEKHGAKKKKEKETGGDK